MRNKRGITLIALVITIIILLILTGITITQLIGNGLFEKVQLAKEKSEKAQAKENSILGDYENTINQYINGTRVGSDKNIVTKFYTLSNDILINNKSEGNEGNVIFDFSDLDTGIYIINVNMWSNADANSNIFGYLQNSEENKSTPSRFYFVGYNGYVESNGSIVIEHTKNKNMKFVVNSYCGKNVTIEADKTNAVAIKIK